MRAASSVFAPRSLCLSLLLFAILTLQAAARLDGIVRPIYEDINLIIDADTNSYSGAVAIALNVPQPVDKIQLHAENMELLTVMLTYHSETKKATWEIGHHGLLTITQDRPFQPGEYELKIEFINDFNTNAVGLYRVIEEGHGYLFTQFEEDDAREAFPCFDEPEFKIPFTITLTVPEAHQAFANTPVTSETIDNGWCTIKFAETKPLPTYLLAIATGTLETVDVLDCSIPVRIITVAGKSGDTKISAAMTPPILKACEDYFGRPYPYAKLDLVAVPEFWAGAMENAGMITFREGGLIADEAATSLGTRAGMASTLAHEIAHMWFGDLVTMKWWDDLWLNESFASWMGDKVTTELFPEANIPISVVRASQRVMSADAMATTSPIRQKTMDEENLLANIGIIYTKGQAVLEMFEKWVGEEPFRKGIQLYLKRHEWGNAVADDLWQALTEATGRDMNAPLSTFVLQPGVPLVTVIPEPNGTVKISQQRFANYGNEFPDAPLWQIPITLKYAINGEVSYQTVLLTDATTEIRLKGETRPDWILPNANMAGYYRWNEPTSSLEPLADNANAHLTPSERVGLLANMSGLLDAGLITGGDYLNMINRFSNDEDPEVISSVVRGINHIYGVFEDDQNQAAFANYIRTTLGPALDQIGRQPRAGEDESILDLRGDLIGYLADEGGDQELLNYVTVEAGRFLEDPTAVDPSLASLFVRLAAINGDQALFDEYKRRFETAANPRERRLFLTALGAFRDSTLVQEALDYALTGPIRPQELGTIPNQITEQSETRHDLVVGWMITHYAQIYERIPPPNRAYMAYYASGCSLERLDRVTAWLTEPELSIPGIEDRLARVAESVHDCVNLKGREAVSVNNFISQYR